MVGETSISDMCYKIWSQSGQRMAVRLICQKRIEVLSLADATISPTLQSLWLAFLLCVQYQYALW